MNKQIAELPSKHSEAHMWTKPETQQVLKALRQSTWGNESKPLYEVTKEVEQEHYIKYTVTGLVKGVGRAELLIASTTKSDNFYLVRHHKQLFNR